MADKLNDPPNPEHGWGQMLPLFFSNANRVVNFAMNGRSTKSFLDEGRWEKVVKSLHRGDYVLIQFGHNDEKSEDPTRYAAPHGAYQENLRRFVHETRLHGATPIFATPVARRRFDGAGTLLPTHGEYPEAMRQVALEEMVPLLEMEKLTSQLEQQAGAEGSKKLHLWIDPNLYTLKPEGWKDDTHYSEQGATKVAALAVQELRRLDLEPAHWLKSTL